MSATLTPLAPPNGAAPPPGLLQAPAPGPLGRPASPLGSPKLAPAKPAKPKLDGEHERQLSRWMDMPNIAEELDDTERGRIADQAKREFTIDWESCADWRTKYQLWLDFAEQISQEKTYPWPKAANIIFPLITTAAIQFNARAYPAIIMGRNVVKGTVLGNDSGRPMIDPRSGQPAVNPQTGEPVWQVQPGVKQDRADKIGQHMSWQLLDEQPEWEEQTDRLLIVLPVVGTMFRKSYHDTAAERNVSETVDAIRLVINFKAKSFADCARMTELIDLYPWEIEERIRSGLFLDYGEEGYGHNDDRGQDEQAFTTFCEQHRRWDLDQDGYAEPYIVTFSKDSGKLARISACFDEDGIEATEDGRVRKITPIRYYTKYGFIPSPSGNVYDIGFGSLLYPLNSAINGSLNQLFDAGHLQVAGGGFIGSGMSMNTGTVRFTMGEFKVVNTPGAILKDNLVPLNFPGPNPVLMNLVQFLVEAAKDAASIKDVLQGEVPGANIPGILGLAVIQQGLKVFSGIYKRIHRSLKHEFDKLFRLNRLYLPDDAGYQIGAEYFQIHRSDYEEGAGVEPVSDPEVVTDMQKMAQANFLLQFATDPDFDGIEIKRRALQAAAIDHIDKLLKDKPSPNGAIVAQMAELHLENKALELRELELRIRAAREEGDLDIRRGKDKAVEIRELTQAILNLALAKKADAAADQGWIDLQLQNLRHQIDLLNTNAEPSADSPAAADGGSGAGGAGGSPQGDNGPGGGGVQGVAPSPGQPSAAGVSG